MKTAVITGCNRGVGEGIKERLLKEGYIVYGLNKTKSNKTQKNYKEIICDIRNYDEVVNSINNIPKIDLLVINAAIRRFNTVEDIDTDDFTDSVNTNLNGAFYCIKESLGKLKETKGDIVIIGSHSEKYSFPKGSAYCTTKGGLRSLAECLSEEVRYEDIRVTYLSLGSIKNRDHNTYEEWKLFPNEIAEAIMKIITLPKKIYIPYVDIRPLKPLKDEKDGIERLQYV